MKQKSGDLIIQLNNSSRGNLSFSDYKINRPYMPIEEAEIVSVTENKTFIEANTTDVTIDHLKTECVIPVFSKDNEVTISHHNFTETV